MKRIAGIVGALLVLCALGVGVSSRAATLSPGDILVNNWINGNIVKIDPVTGAQELVATLPEQGAGLVYTSDGKLYAASNENGNTDGIVYEVNPANGALTSLGFTLAGSLRGIDEDAFGNLLIVNNGAGEVVRYDFNTGIPAVIASGLNFAQDIHVRSATSAWVADFGNDRVIDLNPLTGSYSTYLSGLVRPAGVAESSSGDLWVTEHGAGNLDLFNDPGLFLMFQQSGYANPWDVALESGGSVILTSESGDAVFRYDPGNGGTTLSSFGLLDNPSFIAIIPEAISGSAAVPEPSTTLLIGIAALAIRGLRSRRGSSVDEPKRMSFRSRRRRGVEF